MQFVRKQLTEVLLTVSEGYIMTMMVRSMIPSRQAGRQAGRVSKTGSGSGIL